MPPTLTGGGEAWEVGGHIPGVSEGGARASHVPGKKVPSSEQTLMKTWKGKPHGIPTRHARSVAVRTGSPGVHL